MVGLATYIIRYRWLRLAGAIYLLYLAWKMVRETGTRAEESSRDRLPDRPGATFRRGALVNVLNPKVAIFFLAFLPQFVDPRAEVPAVQILALGLWFDLVGTLVNAGVALLAAGAAARLKSRGWVARAARWIGAGVMSAFAIRLLVAQRR